MDVWHRFDGNLGAYLWNEGATRATAHFAYTIVNKNHDESKVKGDGSTADVDIPKAVLFEGDFEEFFPAVCKDSLGFSLCPAARVYSPTNGFLEKRFLFVVRAEIRLKLQDNERWTVSIKRKTATCTVCPIFSSNHIDIQHLSAVEAKGTTKSVSISIMV